MINTKDRCGIRGEITPWVLNEATGLILPGRKKSNQIQITWAQIACKQIGFRRRPGRPDFSIAGMYIEYENVASPEDEVTVPTDFERHENLQYYRELEGVSTQDYLRVQLLQEPTHDIADGYEAFFTECDCGEGNRLTFMAMTSGSVGMFGRPFSSANNSKVFGASLVAMPVPNDHTQDVIAARTYFSVEDQTVKEASHQVGITWQLIFE